MEPDPVRKTYVDLREKNEVLLASLKKRQLFISLLRLLVFIAGGILSAVAFGNSVISGIFGLLITVFIFLILIAEFGRCSNKIIITENLIRINRNEINALHCDFSAFDGGTDRIDMNHDFSTEIDLFGEDSPLRYLNR